MNSWKKYCQTIVTAILLTGAMGGAYAEQSTSVDASDKSGASSQVAQSGTTMAPGTDPATTRPAQRGAATTPGTGAVHPPVVMLVPVEVASSATNPMAAGCWAQIYDRENYVGDALTLAGPVSLADMSGPFGLNWDDRVNSIVTGPKARVTVYDNENYNDQVAQFMPGQRVPDLSTRLGFFDEFASIRIECQP